MLQPQSGSTSCLTADDHAQYFTWKIDRIRASTAASLPRTIDFRHVPELLSAWWPATVEEVASILKESAAKQCELDPLPTWLVKRANDVLALVIVRMCNTSFSQTKGSPSAARPRRHSATRLRLRLSRLDYCNVVLTGLPAFHDKICTLTATAGDLVHDDLVRRRWSR